MRLYFPEFNDLEKMVIFKTAFKDWRIMVVIKPEATTKIDLGTQSYIVVPPFMFKRMVHVHAR